MKKTLSAIFACALACSAGATHYPPASAGAVKRLAHDDRNLYILHFDGLEVLDKSTGETTWYTQATGHIPEGNIKSTSPNGHEPELNALAVRGDTVWVGGNGFLTAIVGQEAESWHFSYNMSISNPGYPSTSTLPMKFNSIAFGTDGIMYLGGLDQAGYLKPTRKGSFTGLPCNMAHGAEVWQMLPAADGGVWVSYTSDSGKSSLARYTAGDEAEEVSSTLGFTKEIKALAEDASGCLWFGVSSGEKHLYRFDGKSVEGFDIGGGGSPYRGPCCMAFDSTGHLWLLHSNSGEPGYDHWSKGPLCCFDDGETTEYPFPEGVGLAYCIDVDGEDVYVGTDKGVLKLVDGKLVLLDSPWYYNNQEGTAIDDSRISPANERPHGWYDLQGRKRESGKAPNGVHIENGRKTLSYPRLKCELPQG